MRSLIKYLLFLGLLPAFLLTSCKEEATTVDEFATLSQYMVQNGLDLGEITNGWVTSAGGLNVNQDDYSVPDWYVIDLRSADDFAQGHIKDAHNTSLANVLIEAENANGKPILVVCYTGQTAARATGALRLMGYNAKSLKWGMAGWHSDFANSWESNIADLNHANWVTSGDPAANKEYNLPSVRTGYTTGAEILEARVQAMLNQSGWGVNSAAVLDNPGNYFINNKWSVGSWDAFGHITGAYRIDVPDGLSIAGGGLNWLDPSKQIVTYCYTGQTSAITSAWLSVLGYNAVSLKFGVNGIAHSDLVNSSASAKTWKGASSGWKNDFGYYDNDNVMH